MSYANVKQGAQGQIIAFFRKPLSHVRVLFESLVKSLTLLTLPCPMLVAVYVSAISATCPDCPFLACLPLYHSGNSAAFFKHGLRA